MKIWRWLVILLILALLASYTFLGTGYLKQNRLTKNHMTELSGLKTVLSMIPGIPTNLDQRLAEAQVKLAEAEKAFAGETNGTTIVDTVLRLAEEAGVKGVPLSTEPWAIELISNRDFSVFHLKMEVTGDSQHIQDYLKLLENSGPNTMTVKYLKVVRASANAGAIMTADLDIAVYTLAPAVN